MQDLNAALRQQHGRARSNHENYSNSVHSRHGEVSTPQARDRASFFGTSRTSEHTTLPTASYNPNGSAGAGSIGQRLDSLVHRLAANGDSPSQSRGSISLPVPLPQPRSSITHRTVPSDSPAAAARPAAAASGKAQRRPNGARPPSRGSTDLSSRNDDISGIRPRVRAFEQPAEAPPRVAVDSPPDGESRGMGAMQRARPASAAGSAHKRGQPTEQAPRPPPAAVQLGGSRRVAFSETAEVDGFTAAPVTYNIPIVVTNSAKHRRASSAVVRAPKVPVGGKGLKAHLPNEPRAIPGRREGSAHVSRGTGGIMGGARSARATVGRRHGDGAAQHPPSRQSSDEIVQQLLDVDAEMLQWEASLERQRAKEYTGAAASAGSGANSPQTGYSGLFMSSPLKDGVAPPSPASSLASQEGGPGASRRYPPVSPITGATRPHQVVTRVRRVTDGAPEFTVPARDRPPLHLQPQPPGDLSPTSAVWDMALQSGMERMLGRAATLHHPSQLQADGHDAEQSDREFSWGNIQPEGGAVDKRPPLRSRSGTTRRKASLGVDGAAVVRRRVQSAVTAHYRKPEGCRLGDDFLTLFAPVAETAEDEEGSEWGEGNSPGLTAQSAGLGSAGASPDALALSGVIEDTTGGVLAGIDTSWGGADGDNGASRADHIAAGGLSDEDDDDVVELVWDAAAQAQMGGLLTRSR